MNDKRKNFRHYNLNDLLTIYQFISDFFDYKSNFILLTDLEDEIDYRLLNI